MVRKQGTVILCQKKTNGAKDIEKKTLIFSAQLIGCFAVLVLVWLSFLFEFGYSHGQGHGHDH